MEAAQNTLFMRELSAKSRASSRVRVASSDDIDQIVSSNTPKHESFTFVTPELRSKFDTISRVHIAEHPPDAAVPVYEPFSTKYSFADLQNGKLLQCDPANLERYLSDEEFVKVFKMSPTEFARLPQWKQKQAKTKAKLF